MIFNSILLILNENFSISAISFYFFIIPVVLYLTLMRFLILKKIELLTIENNIIFVIK